MLMWRREERREMIAWLLVKHQAGHGCIGSSGPKKPMLSEERRKRMCFRDN
jgi:hypothetical protein